MNQRGGENHVGSKKGETNKAGNVGKGSKSEVKYWPGVARPGQQHWQR